MTHSRQAPSASLTFDDLFGFLLVALACLPLAQIIQLNAGFAIVTMADAIQVLILIVCLTMGLSRGVIAGRSFVMLCILAVLLGYLVSALVRQDVSIGQITTQSRLYLPFVVGCAILAIRAPNIAWELLLRRVVVAAAVSAFGAVVLRLFFPGIVAHALAASEDAVYIATVGGRMYWDGTAISYLAVAGVLLLHRDRALVVTCLFVVALAVVFTQSRTTLLGMALLYVAGKAIVGRSGTKAIVTIGVVALILLGAFIALASEDMVQLLLRRLFITEESGSELEHSYDLGRLAQYVQYLETFRDTFPFGQGLGPPMAFSAFTGDPLFLTDISLIAFVLPFGIPGLLIFTFFVAACGWSLRASARRPDTSNVAKIFIVVFVVTLASSFNIDLYSRSIFVIYLAAFVALIEENRESRRGRLTLLASQSE